MQCLLLLQVNYLVARTRRGSRSWSGSTATPNERRSNFTCCQQASTERGTSDPAPEVSAGSNRHRSRRRPSRALARYRCLWHKSCARRLGVNSNAWSLRLKWISVGTERVFCSWRLWKESPAGSLRHDAWGTSADPDETREVTPKSTFR